MAVCYQASHLRLEKIFPKMVYIWSFPIILLQVPVILYFIVFIGYLEVILFSAVSFTKSKLAGKFQIYFQKTAVRGRRRLKGVVCPFMRRCVNPSKRKRAVVGNILELPAPFFKYRFYLISKKSKKS